MTAARPGALSFSMSARRRVLNPVGKYIAVGGPSSRWMIGPLARALAALVLSRFVSQKLVMFIARESKEELALMRELMEAGKVTPVIDRRDGLSEVPEAIRHLEEGHAQGKVVITLEHDSCNRASSRQKYSRQRYRVTSQVHDSLLHPPLTCRLRRRRSCARR